MKRKDRAVWVALALIILFFVVSTSSFAEIITLKSGEKFSAKIVEKNDKYIIINFYGADVIYQMYEVENISEEQDNPNPGGSLVPTTSLGDSGFALDWQAWYTKVSRYLAEVDALMMESNKIGIQVNARLQEAISKGDSALHQQIIRQWQNALTAFISKLHSLVPPAELSLYHEKVLAGYQNRNASSQSSLNQDDSGTLNYERMAIQSFMEAAVELKRLYLEHGAPEGAINGLENIVDNFQRLLNQ